MSPKRVANTDNLSMARHGPVKSRVQLLCALVRVLQVIETRGKVLLAERKVGRMAKECILCIGLGRIWDRTTTNS